MEKYRERDHARVNLIVHMFPRQVRLGILYRGEFRGKGLRGAVERREKGEKDMGRQSKVVEFV